MKKICTNCKVNKSLKEFHRDTTKEDGRRSQCKNCHSIYKKVYRVKNKQRILDRDKKYYAKNNKKIIKYQKNYRAENKPKILEAAKKYYAKNKEKIRNKQAEYFKTDKGKLAKVKSEHNSKIKKINSINNLTSRESNIILSLQQYKCICCEQYFDKINPTLDHIIPLSKGGDLIKENVQYLCQSCNSSKHTKEIDYRSTIHKQYIKTMELICHNNLSSRCR